MFPTICNLIYHYTMTPGLALKCCLVYPTNRVRDSANEVSTPRFGVCFPQFTYP